MNIKLYLKDSPAAFTFENVIDTYQEGNLFCIFIKECVHKFPVQHIFKITQTGMCAGSEQVPGKTRGAK